MDFGKIISTGFGQAWKYKSLWILGFLLSLGEGGGNYNYNFGQNENIQIPDWLGIENIREFDFLRFITDHALLIAMIILGLFLLFVIFFILSRIACGALIDAGGKFKRDEAYTLGSSFRIGVSRFWSLLGIALLNIIVVVGLVLFLVLLGMIAFYIHIAIGIMSLLVLIPILIIGIFIMTATVAMAERYIVLEKRPVFDAIVDGWNLWTSSKGNTVLYALIYIALAIGLMIGIGFILLAIALPFIALGIVNLFLALLLGIPVALLLLLVFEGFSGSAMHLMTTEFYFQLREKTDIPKGAVQAPDQDGYQPPTATGEI